MPDLKQWLARSSDFLRRTVTENPYIPQVPEPKQALFLSVTGIEAMYGGSAGGGKEQPLDAEVLTIFGPRPMGCIEVGDWLASPTGGATQVVALSEIHNSPVYTLHFNDGTKARCHGQHLWAGWKTRRGTKHDGDRLFGLDSARCYTADQAREITERAKFNGEWFTIPLVQKPLAFTCNRFMGDAYLLGALLGDGCFSQFRCVSFSSGTEDFENHWKLYFDGCDFDYRVDRRNDTSLSIVFRGRTKSKLCDWLNRMKLSGKKGAEKFIPKTMPWSATETRLALLQGLLDTDGFADDRGYIEFSNISKNISDAVAFICRSLGGRVTTTECQGHYRDKSGEVIGCSLYYRLHIRLPKNICPFRMERKATRFSAGTDKQSWSKKVVDVTVGEAVEMRCLQVSKLDGLYCTNDCTVTHNSSALLMAALQFVHTTKNYSALLLRKTYADLNQPGALIPRSIAWLGRTDAQWRGSDHSWTFPKTGAVLKFGYLDTALDIYQFQSSEYQFIGFDETSQFREHDYRYLFSRLRKPSWMAAPLRMRSASNPGGIGHEWVKRRFLIEGKQNGRWFIPATLDDNSHIDREAYVQSLSNLDPVTRAQLLRGDWSARQGGRIFRREWFGVPMPQAPEGLRWCRFWDMAATAEGSGDPDWTSGALMACQEGVWWIRDIRRFRGTPKDNEDIVSQTAALDGRDVMVRMEQEPGASGKSMIDHYARSVLVGFDFSGVPSHRNKLLRAGPFSSAAEAGNMRLVSGPWIGDFLDEVESFTGDGKEHDDQVDAVTGAMSALSDGGSGDSESVRQSREIGERGSRLPSRRIVL